MSPQTSSSGKQPPQGCKELRAPHMDSPGPGVRAEEAGPEGGEPGHVQTPTH